MENSIRTDEEIIVHIKEIMEDYVTPAVQQHGGMINFLSYEDGVLRLQLSGSCSGCAGSTFTLKQGVEQLMQHHVPEVEVIEHEDDAAFNDPYYKDWSYDYNPSDYPQDGDYYH